MRTWLVPLLAAMTALALLAPTAMAENDKKDGKTVDLYAIEDTSTLITREGEVYSGDDEPDFDPDVGDRFVVLESVYYDAERTDEAGRNHIECTISESVGEFPEMEPAEGEPWPSFAVSFVCSGVLDLHEHGTMSWSGVTGFTSEDEFEEGQPESPFIVLAVTGGTGGLIGASGEVVVYEEDTGSDDILSRYEVHLLHGKHALLR
jgi:hypothetical protein